MCLVEALQIHTQNWSEIWYEEKNHMDCEIDILFGGQNHSIKMSWIIVYFQLWMEP